MSKKSIDDDFDDSSFEAEAIQRLLKREFLGGKEGTIGTKSSDPFWEISAKNLPTLSGSLLSTQLQRVQTPANLRQVVILRQKLGSETKSI